MESSHVTICDFIHGPFVIVITDPNNPSDAMYPIVVSPSGGYKTKEEALGYIEVFAKREKPYLGLHFAIAQLQDEQSFGAYCSWEG